jgi:hypothetical protein
VNGIEHVVVEVEFVRSDAGLLEWVYAKCGDEHFAAVFLLDECVYVRGIGGIVQSDQRRIHMAGR